MSVTAADRAELRRMLAVLGYAPSAAAYELSTRPAGADRADLYAAAVEIMDEVRGTHRPLAPLGAAFARRAALFGAYDGAVSC